MSKFLKVALGLLFAVIIYLIYWFISNTEEVESREYVGFQGEAKIKPYLALQRLSERLMNHTDSEVNLSSWGQFSRDEIVFVPLEYIPTDISLFSDLEEWLNQGGVLITGSTRSRNDFEVDFSPMHERLFGLKSIEGENGKQFNHKLGDHTVQMLNAFSCELSGYSEEYRSDDGKLLYAVKSMGKGKIYFFNSLRAFDNRNLRDQDNAVFFFSLFDREKNMVLATRPEYMGVWSWIKTRARITLILLISVIVAWLLMVSKRFGPLALDKSVNSRKIMEHIKVSGEYQWRAKQGHLLVEELRLNIQELLKMRHPQTNRFSSSEQTQYLGNLCALESQDVFLSMTETYKTPEQFYKIVMILKKIKDSL
ncbi:hypothetical protein PQO01_11750 [Lentisphaera marina]|uniref:hypothetical protein n=1 Tax=Lentisphaera marina TaxID=1111041 RepID=UPI002365D3EB|nr:hypothetical protein [Lentisphaera marina]MDD7985623.1 hypothetical protein [Lentisphaera marina]